MEKNIYLLNSDAQEMKVSLIFKVPKAHSLVLMNIHGGHPMSFSAKELKTLIRTLVDINDELFEN